MKMMIVVVIVIAVIAGAVGVNFLSVSENQNTNALPQNITTKPPTHQDYKNIGSDKDDVVESNNALILKIESNQKQNNDNVNNTTPTNTAPALIKNKKLSINQQKIKQVTNKIVDKSTNAVNKIVDNLSLYKINNSNESYNNYNENIYQNNSGSGFVWSKTNLSSTPTIAVNLQNSDSQIKPVKEENIIKKYTIPANSVFESINMTALLGRIPIASQVHNPYRFTLKIKNKGLFANNHKNNSVVDMLVSGTASGDLLLSCVRGSIDSITYIFVDGTITQNNDVEYATITDEYGLPCIKGELVTNAPQHIATSSVLAGLSGAAQALANAEKSSTTDNSGNTTSQITGDAGKNAIYSALAGATSDTQKWVNERAKSSFDVIVVPAGKQINLFFNKSVEIDYDKEGRKLIHHTSTNNLNNYEKLD